MIVYHMNVKDIQIHDNDNNNDSKDDNENKDDIKKNMKKEYNEHDKRCDDIGIQELHWYMIGNDIDNHDIINSCW